MKICFFGKFTNAIKGQTQGGAQLQIALLAKALSLKNHQVTVIDPFAEEDFLSNDGIQIRKVPNWNKGIRGLRFFTTRVPSLFHLFKQQNTDYYFVTMRYYLYLIPFIISRKTKAKFILLIASDIDVLSLYKRYKFEYKGNIGLLKYLTLSLPNDLVFNYLLKHSDMVLFQHHDQKKLAGKLKNKSAIFHNILDLKNLPQMETLSEGYYIYVGSLTLLKGSEFLLTVAKSTPTKTIMIVGQPRDAISETIFTELKKCPNVIIKGWQKHDETLRLIAKAKALINTSYFEGFPNIYLEAWALGIPVISLNVNPDNIINQFNLGVFCEGDLNQMIAYIENGNTDSFNRTSLIEYVARFHDFETTNERFTTILEEAFPFQG